MDNGKLDKQLRGLFKEAALSNPSPSFMENVMQAIEKEAERRKRKQRWSTVLQLVAGVVGLLSLPGVVFYVYSLLNPEFTFSFNFFPVDAGFYLMVLSVAVSVLFLLMADNLFEKYLFKKKFKDLLDNPSAG